MNKNSWLIFVAMLIPLGRCASNTSPTTDAAITGKMDGPAISTGGMTSMGGNLGSGGSTRTGGTNTATGGASENTTTGGANRTGGVATGGVATGGVVTGGVVTGGTATGGNALGGTSTGGTATGGSGGMTGGTGKGGTMTGGTVASACDEAKAVWTSTEPFSKHSFGIHTLRNNVWGLDRQGYVAGQSIWGISERCWGVKAAHLNGNGLVKAYPNSLRGWALGDGIVKPDGGLPIKVSELTKAKIYWKMSAPTDGRFMALWDIYFHSTDKPLPEQKSHTNLQIFQRIADADGYFRGEAKKGQAKTYGGIPFMVRLEAGDTMSGTNAVITLYMGPADVNPMGAEEKLFDLKAILTELMADGTLAPDLYLTSIQNGWEIIVGTEFKTLDYWSAIQNDPEG